MNKIKLLIADDHPMFRMGLEMMLSGNDDMEVVATAANGQEALEKMPFYKPDVVLMDLIMPVMDGAAAAERIYAEYPDTKVLILSSDTSVSSVERLLSIGIQGFISKISQKKDILAAINTVAAGYEYYGADVARIIEGIHTARNVDNSIFTPRELDIIRLSCDGLQYKEMADKLGIATKTVENIKANILHKLGINNTVELFRYALSNGIISL